MPTPAPRIPTTSPVEDCTYGVIRYTIEDSKITVIQTEGDMSRQAIDAWAAAIHKTFNEGTAKTLYCLFEMSHPRQGFTPYATRKADEVYTYLPADRNAIVALLFPNTLIFRAAANFVRMRTHKNKNAVGQVFTDKEPALRWLRDRLPPASQP